MWHTVHYSSTVSMAYFLRLMAFIHIFIVTNNLTCHAENIVPKAAMQWCKEVTEKTKVHPLTKGNLLPALPPETGDPTTHRQCSLTHLHHLALLR